MGSDDPTAISFSPIHLKGSIMIVTLMSTVFTGAVRVSVPDKHKDGSPMVDSEEIMEKATDIICNIKPEEVSCMRIDTLTSSSIVD